MGQAERSFQQCIMGGERYPGCVISGVKLGRLQVDHKVSIFMCGKIGHYASCVIYLILCDCLKLPNAI